ncbi:MAG: GntR family transcriptional regulator [Pseudomonadota bacterium]
MALTSTASGTIDADVVPRLPRRTLAEFAADELRKLILLEKFAPGAAIPERETAEALGVSRTPLREALRRLSIEGLVVIKPLKAPTVANPSLAELQSLLQVQGALEGLAGELACAEASDAELREICRLEAQVSDRAISDEPLAFFEADMALHAAIVQAANNPPLAATHATYNARLWRARFISSCRLPNRERTLKEHTQIVSALMARDPRKAASALKQHLKTTVRNIVQASATRDNEEARSK